MSFVLVTFALLAATGLLMQFCLRLLSEAALVLNGLSAQNWLDTTQQLAAAATELDDRIASSRTSWAE